jgi:ribosomal protein S6
VKKEIAADPRRRHRRREPRQEATSPASRTSKFTGAAYVHVNFSAPPEGPAQLRERLRLNGSVYRTFVQEV